MAKLWPQKFRRVLPHTAVGPKLHPKSFFLALSQQHLLDLVSLANAHLSHARNKFDNANSISTWLPSPPHIRSYPWTLPSWNKRWPPPDRPSDLETLHRDIWAMEQLCQRNSQITYSGQWDNWEKDKIKWLPLYLSQTPSANTATVCCWSISASAKPAVSITNLLLQSFRAWGTRAAKVGMVLWARRTISSQLNKYWRTEEQKQAWGIRDRFQAAALYAPTWPVPSSSVACSGRKQSLQHLK